MQFSLKENTGLYLDQRIISMVGGVAGVEHHERPTCIDRLDVLRREMPDLAFAGMNVGATGALLVSVDPLLLAVPLFAIPSLWAGARAERIRQEALDATADRSRRAGHFLRPRSVAALPNGSRRPARDSRSRRLRPVPYGQLLLAGSEAKVPARLPWALAYPGVVLVDG